MDTLLYNMDLHRATPIQNHFLGFYNSTHLFYMIHSSDTKNIDKLPKLKNLYYANLRDEKGRYFFELYKSF